MRRSIPDSKNSSTAWCRRPTCSTFRTALYARSPNTMGCGSSWRGRSSGSTTSVPRSPTPTSRNSSTRCGWPRTSWTAARPTTGITCGARCRGWNSCSTRASTRDGSSRARGSSSPGSTRPNSPGRSSGSMSADLGGGWSRAITRAWRPARSGYEVITRRRVKGSEPPAPHVLGHDAEHHTIRRHDPPVPVLLELRVVLRQKPLDELSSRWRIVEKLGTTADRHAFDLVVTDRAGLGNHAHARIAFEIPNLGEIRHADHRQRVVIGEEPHRHRERRAVGIHGREHDDVLRGEERLDLRISQRRAHAPLPITSWAESLVPRFELGELAHEGRGDFRVHLAVEKNGTVGRSQNWTERA